MKRLREQSIIDNWQKRLIVCLSFLPAKVFSRKRWGWTSEWWLYFIFGSC